MLALSLPLLCPQAMPHTPCHQPASLPSAAGTAPADGPAGWASLSTCALVWAGLVGRRASLVLLPRLRQRWFIAVQSHLSYFLRSQAALGLHVVHGPGHAIGDDAPAYVHHTRILDALGRVLLGHGVSEGFGFHDGLRLTVHEELIIEKLPGDGVGNLPTKIGDPDVGQEPEHGIDEVGSGVRLTQRVRREVGNPLACARNCASASSNDRIVLTSTRPSRVYG